MIKSACPWALGRCRGLPRRADTAALLPLIEELQELGGCKTRLAQDGSQRAALHDAVLRDDDHAPVLISVHRVAPLGPHIREADRVQRADDLAYRQVR